MAKTRIPITFAADVWQSALEETPLDDSGPIWRESCYNDRHGNFHACHWLDEPEQEPDDRPFPKRAWFGLLLFECFAWGLIGGMAWATWRVWW